MIKFYIIDENGTYTSANGKTHFTCLTGEEIYAYFQLPKGKGKLF